MNGFINALSTTPDTLTENGALAFSTTNSSILDLFGKLNQLNPDVEELYYQLEQCWIENPEVTVRLIAYIRTISRKGKLCELPMRGAGLKSMGRIAMQWLYINHRNVFIKNMLGFIEVGSWQDFWHKEFTDWIIAKDQEVVSFIVNHLTDPLCLKYLPRYRTTSNINRVKSEDKRAFKRLRNEGIKLLVDYINMHGLTKKEVTVQGLMKFKANKGSAHRWQQLITNQKYEQIDFNKLPGKVLSWISDNRDDETSFLSRHNLVYKFLEWLDKQPMLKTTSYLYELIKPITNSRYRYKDISKVKEVTINKQVKTILSKVGDSKLNIMPLIDTSGSMTSSVGPTTAYDIAVSLGVYYSMKQTGAMKDTVIMFDNVSQYKHLKGEYVDRVRDIMNSNTAWGGTNFQSVIDLVVKTRKKNPQIPIEDYPQVYLSISDMEFNNCGDYTNHEEACRKLKQVGLPQPLFIWWDVSGDGDSYQNQSNDEGVMIISGFDPSIVDMLMSEDFQRTFEKSNDKKLTSITPEEACKAALSQEYLTLFTV